MIAIFGPKSSQTPEIKKIAEALGAVLLDQWRGEKIDVLISTFDNLEQSRALLREIPKTKFIAVGPKSTSSVQSIMKVLSEMTLFAWVESFTSDEFQTRTLQALDEAREARQASESLVMYLEHNQSLQRLSEELENRIETRRAELGESTWRLQQSQRRSEIMHRALNAVHVSQSLPEMERLLLSILHPHNHASLDAPNVEWIRIAFAAQTSLNERSPSNYSVQLGQNGFIHFSRTPDRPFRSEDKNFLNPIAEAVSLAVTRLHSLERMEQIKREWEETFNAIVNPVAVLDEQLRLVRGNRALLGGRAPEDVVGRQCFEAVFGRNSPCPGCPVIAELNSNHIRGRRRNVANTRTMQFRVSPRLGAHGQILESFEVSSRPLTKVGLRDENQDESGESSLMVHLYRDATTTARFEKRIVESSKMAELGTIGSSIAHQLNNPIGGMLSHIQLLLMDLKTMDFPGKEDLFLELKEMEKGTRRCAEIVRDLLGFTRRGDEDQAHDHDFNEIVEQAIKITELQTRSRGIRFNLVTTDDGRGSFLVHGRFNLLAQAVRAVLLAMLPSGIRDQQIELRIKANGNNIEVIAQTSGSTEASRENLDLTVAEQILSEHGGSLSISKTDLVQQAILSLPRSNN